MECQKKMEIDTSPQEEEGQLKESCGERRLVFHDSKTMNNWLPPAVSAKSVNLLGMKRLAWDVGAKYKYYGDVGAKYKYYEGVGAKYKYNAST